MGSAASNISPPASPTAREQLPHLGTGSAANGSDHLIMSHHDVAPIVIKDCREEFQKQSKFKDPIVMGRIAEGTAKHPLVKGKYFLVADSQSSKRAGSMGGRKTPTSQDHPELRQAGRSLPVYGCAQPTRSGVINTVEKLLNKHEFLLLFNTREEPVLFPARCEHTYSVRHMDNLKDIVYLALSDPDSSEREARTRREVVDLSSLDEINKFYFYDDIKCFNNEPHVLDINSEDDILVSEEVYTRLTFKYTNFRFRRLCFPIHGAPSFREIDDFLAEIKLKIRLGDRDPSPPAVLFICDKGDERTSIGMVMTSLLYSHIVDVDTAASKTLYQINDKCPNYGRGEFLAVREVVRAIPDGTARKQEVDSAIDQCSGDTNLRGIILQTKQQLETCQDEADKKDLRNRCVEQLQRYVFLICYNAYLKEQVPRGLKITYSNWMRTHPSLFRHLCHVDNSERSAQHLLALPSRVLVADDYIGLDVLSSLSDVRVANFRKLQGLPIYGMAQAPRDGLSRVVSHLLDKRQGYKHVEVIGLRNDVTVECDGFTYNVRDVSNMEEPVLIAEITGPELEQKEETLKKEVKAFKHLEVYQETCNPPVSAEFASIMSPEDLWEQQKLQTLDMGFTRIPLQYDHSPTEKEIDQLHGFVCSHYKSAQGWTDSPVALVFTCRTGKSRTSLAMAIAGLIFYNKRGIPYGSRPDELERTSCPNAAYTQGDFIIVQKLVRLLPDGQQVKREVDLVLDQLFETMSPMHFHLREIIFVTYNKIKASRSDTERQSLCRLSVDFLERYLLLILFNAFLHYQNTYGWEDTFCEWMTRVAARAGVYDLLDNLAFYDFEQTLSHFRTRKERWAGRKFHLNFHGHFI